MRVLAPILLAGALWLPMQPASAAELPDSENMGKLLAYTVNCGCVVGDRDWILGVYQAVFADAYGEAYANALQAPLQGALKDGWDRHMGLCERICDLPVTRELQHTLARADGGAVDGSGIRTILGAPPADGSGIVVSGSDVSTAAQSAPAAPDAAVEETGVNAESAALLPTYCVFRPMAKGCMPEDRPSDAAAPSVPAASILAAGDAQGTPTVAAGESAGATVQATAEPEPAAPAIVEDVEPATVSAALEPAEDVEVWEQEEAASKVPDLTALYQTSGSGYVASSSYCRSSPTRPGCRRIDAE